MIKTKKINLSQAGFVHITCSNQAIQKTHVALSHYSFEIDRLDLNASSDLEQPVFE